MADKGESSDQSERTVQAKSTPKDALVMGAILKEMGINEYEPRVINQMLEFTYRYITTVLEDAQVYRKHAGKKELDAEDVQLAIQTRLDHSYTSPPPREFLIEIARQKNRHPLPQIQTKSGLRLPPDRYCLTSTNYKVKAQKKQHSQVRVNPLVSRTISQSSALSSTVTPIKTTPATIIAVKMPATVSAATGASPSITTPASTPAVVAGGTGTVKTEPLSGGGSTHPLPAVAGKTHTVAPALQVKTQETTSTSVATTAAASSKAGTAGIPASMLTVSALPSMDETVASTQQPLISALKRKHEDEDDDYDC